MSAQSTLLEAALTYARRGWPVFPLHCPVRGGCSCSNADCDSVGKHPRTSRGHKDATVDIATIEKWWKRWPDANIGMPTGSPSGLVALDVDPRHGGEESFALLESEHDDLSSDLLSRTGGAGVHIFFGYPGVTIKNKVGLRPGLDVRGDGGYVVLPPSLHASGSTYSWIAESDPAPMPDWLRSLLSTKETRKPIVSKNGATTPYAAAALRNECEKVASTPEGQRNKTLNSASFSLGQLVGGGEADEFQATAELRQAGLASGLPEREVERTIRSGLNAGISLPRKPALRKTSQPGSPPSKHNEYILVPGQHQETTGQFHEIGTDRFARTVLRRIPSDAVYRWDFVVGEIIGPQSEQRFRPMTEHDVRMLTDGHVKLAKWIKTKTGDLVRVFVACHRDLGALILAAAGSSTRVRALRLLPHYPVYGPEFTLLRPGWNECGVYYDQPNALEGIAPITHNPLAILEDLLIDFPFKDRASMENVFGLMLTPILRPAIPGVIPFHLVFASLERTGKGKLIDAALGHAVVGGAIPTMQLGSTEEEREKRITASIIEGATALHFDNLPVEEVLDSAALASLGTSTIWKGRLLGKSKLPSLPNNLVVVMSGNNVKATGELVKRTVPIILQPLDDHPEDRNDFKHPLIHEYARAQRPQVVGALLGMVENWKAAGRPRSKVVMGGYEDWVSTVGGILQVAGATKWMSNYREWVRGADPWSSDAEVLIAYWHEKYGDREVTATDVLFMIRACEIFPGVIAGPPNGHVVMLAKRVLNPLADRPVKGWIVRRTSSGSSSRYRLEPAIR